jgi:enolase-phosphatase E1
MSTIHLNAKCILLDIEGTVSDVRFVYDVMFPYAKRELAPFLVDHWSNPTTSDAIAAIAKDAGHPSVNEWLGPDWQSNSQASIHKIVDHLHALMATDSKATGLKLLQGMVWKSGFESGALRAELFEDVLPALQRWHQAGLDIRIYSSGSILAQKMFFKHTVMGDLSYFFRAHYDTTIGNKKESSSYERIVQDSGYTPNDMVFVSDVAAELMAATLAGMQVVASVRPNNAPLQADYRGHTVTSFDQLLVKNS